MKKIFILLFLIAVALNANSQKSEVGLILGGTLFKGDVNRIFTFREAKPGAGILYRKYFSEKFSIRPSIIYTAVAGEDYHDESFSNKDIFYKTRGLHFRSKIVELNVLAEFSLLKGKKTTPYFFGGPGIFYFNSQAKYKGEWVDLQPLGTEGQGIEGSGLKKYKRLQPNLILGLGWKFKIGNYFGLNIESGLRMTATDYIDDVSGEYFDKATLYANNGALSATLSDRSGDQYYDVQIISQSGFVPDSYSESGLRAVGYGTQGDKRGDSRNKDKYLVCNFTFTYTFAHHKVQTMPYDGI